jgi:hypothetical protein
LAFGRVSSLSSAAALTERGHRYLFAIMAISLAGLIARASVLHAGFIVDDYAQLSMMTQTYPVPRAPLALFTFTNGEPDENQALKDAGYFPWWTHGDLKIALFRPLASALMWLDRLSFGDNALLYHVHSAAWWLGMSVAWGLLLRRWLPTAFALLAHALCTLHPANGMLLGWIANRNASVAMLFGLCSLWLQVKRRDGIERARWLIPVCWALTLLAGEYGVSFLVFCVMFELSSTESNAVKRTRLLPGFVVLLSYAVLRAALHFGSRHSGMYIDPVGEPLAFLTVAAGRGTALLADLVLGIRSNWWSAGYPWEPAWSQALGLPLDWSFDLRSLRPLQLAAGLVAVAVAAVIAWLAQRETPEVRFAALALPLAVLPALGGTPESRLLLPAMFAWTLLLVTLLARSWQRRKLGVFVILGLLTLLQAVASFSYSNEDRALLPRVASATRASILAPALDEALATVEDAYLVAAVDPTTTIYIPMLRRWHKRVGPARCHLLWSTVSFMRIERLSERTFRMSREQQYYTPPDVYAETFRREPVQAGEVFTTRAFRATVEQAHDGRPTVVRFDTERNLDDEAVTLLNQDALGLTARRFPPVGQSVVIPPPNFPFALMR